MQTGLLSSSVLTSHSATSVPFLVQVMSSQKKAGKAAPKSSKAEKASFEKVITALEKENEAFVIPKGQKMMFHIASVLAAASPVVLFWGGGSATSSNWSAVYEGYVHENLVWYLVCVVVSAALLSHSYTQVATRTRKQLLLSREPVNEGERANKELKLVAGNESAYYSLFATNALFLALFLLNVRYVLSAQELPERVNFAFASIAAAGVTAGIVAIKAL